uniref:Nucleoside triphosphatase n=1 Tax=Fervidicoccus fontis TaxID=683846 RepID=A0A7J3ZKD4_9CREN
MLRERPTKIFITGPPSSGKTTIVMKAVELAKKAGINVKGFFTPELRRHGVRTGFDIQVIDGERIPLARKGVSGWPIKFGSYMINPNASRVFKNILVETLGRCDLLVLDEIGPMELLVEGAREFFIKALEDEGQHVLGVVHRKLRDYDEILYKEISKHKVYSTTVDGPERISSSVEKWIEGMGARIQKS